MQPLAAVMAWSVCLSVCVCVSVGHTVSPIKTDELIEMPVGLAQGTMY